MTIWRSASSIVRAMVAVAMLTAITPPARAANSEPLDVARLEQQLRESHYARIGVAGRTFVLVEPRVGPDGLTFDRVEGFPKDRAAIVTGANWDSIAPPSNPVPWSTLERIESGKRTRLPGAMIGGGIGLVTGLLVGGFLGYVAEMSGNGDETQTMVGITAFSTGLGMAVGAAFPKTRWTQVHPAAQAVTR
jgi:hypothetical protein